MGHLANLLVLLGLVLALPAGFGLGYWWRGKRRKMVI